MKYTIKELLDNNEIMSHLFLNCVPQEKLEEIAKREGTIDSKKVNIEMKVDGNSINPREFFRIFIDQYDYMVKEAATKIVKEQTSQAFKNITDRLYEYEQITNEWANDIDWQVDNIFEKEKE